MNYIKPIRRPKTQSSGSKKTALGLRREAVLNEWAAHAQFEHNWGERYGSLEDLQDCPDCADFVGRLKESEEWK